MPNNFNSSFRTGAMLMNQMLNRQQQEEQFKARQSAQAQQQLVNNLMEALKSGGTTIRGLEQLRPEVEAVGGQHPIIRDMFNALGANLEQERLGAIADTGGLAGSVQATPMFQPVPSPQQRMAQAVQSFGPQGSVSGSTTDNAFASGNRIRNQVQGFQGGQQPQPAQTTERPPVLPAAPTQPTIPQQQVGLPKQTSQPPAPLAQPAASSQGVMEDFRRTIPPNQLQNIMAPPVTREGKINSDVATAQMQRVFRDYQKFALDQGAVPRMSEFVRGLPAGVPIPQGFRPRVENEFNRDVQSRIAERMRGRSAKPAERNMIREETVLEVAEQYGGFVSPKFEKLLTDKDAVAQIELSTKVKNWFADNYGYTQDDLRALKEADYPAFLSLLETAASETGTEVHAVQNTNVLNPDGTRQAVALVTTKDKYGRTNTFTAPIDGLLQGQTIAGATLQGSQGDVLGGNKTETDVRQRAETLDRFEFRIQGFEDQIAKYSDAELNARIGGAGAFNRFINAAQATAAGLAQQAGSSLSAGEYMQKVFDTFGRGDMTSESQQLFTEYMFLVFDAAAISGAGTGRDLSDKDFDRLAKTVSASSADSLKGSIESLKREAEIERRVLQRSADRAGVRVENLGSTFGAGSGGSAPKDLQSAQERINKARKLLEGEGN